MKWWGGWCSGVPGVPLGIAPTQFQRYLYSPLVHRIFVDFRLFCLLGYLLYSSQQKESNQGRIVICHAVFCVVSFFLIDFVFFISKPLFANCVLEIEQAHKIKVIIYLLVSPLPSYINSLGLLWRQLTDYTRWRLCNPYAHPSNWYLTVSCIGGQSWLRSFLQRWRWGIFIARDRPTLYYYSSLSSFYLILLHVGP